MKKSLTSFVLGTAQNTEAVNKQDKGEIEQTCPLHSQETTSNARDQINGVFNHILQVIEKKVFGRTRKMFKKGVKIQEKKVEKDLKSFVLGMLG